MAFEFFTDGHSMKIIHLIAGCLLAGVFVLAHAQGNRFKPMAEGDMTDVQKQAIKDMIGGLRGHFNWDGPNALLLRSPELQSRTQKVGEYLRYKSAIPHRLNEFAILITARQWASQGEWLQHEALAEKAGIAPATIADLKQGKRPGGMQDDESLVYQFLTELHATKTVSESIFNAAKQKFGEQGVIDLAAVSGYYTMLAMILGVAGNPVPVGVTPPLPALK
jgi:4-carboxymuconolactone decarboxylase